MLSSSNSSHLDLIHEAFQICQLSCSVLKDQLENCSKVRTFRVLQQLYFLKGAELL